MAIDKTVDSSQLNAGLKAVADAIRAKGGTSDTMSFPDGFMEAVGAIEAGSGGGSDELFIARIQNTLEEATLPLSVTYVGQFGFANATSLKRITGNGVTKLDPSAFANCTSLVEVNLPNWSWQFNAKQAFDGCSSLTSISFPALTSLGSSSGYTFRNCTSLVSVNLPSLVKGSMQMFSGCKALPLIDLPALVAINSTMFPNCSSLKTIILRRSELVPLEAVSGLNGTPFASGGTGGTVYIPSALIESYQTATNWSTLYAAGTCTFAAIEGSEYE